MFYIESVLPWIEMRKVKAALLLRTGTAIISFMWDMLLTGLVRPPLHTSLHSGSLGAAHKGFAQCNV